MAIAAETAKAERKLCRAAPAHVAGNGMESENTKADALDGDKAPPPKTYYGYPITRLLLQDEDPENFDILARQAVSLFKPENYLEYLAMTDFIYAHWELCRLRRLAPAAFVAARPFVINKLYGISEEQFSDGSFMSGGFEQQTASLAARGHDEDALNAQALLMFSSTFESFDKRAALLEMRRDNAWEKVTRWRSNPLLVDSKKQVRPEA